MSKKSRADLAAERRARVEELRRAQRAKERRRTLIVVAVAGVVTLIIAVALVISLTGGGSDDKVDAGNQIIPAPPEGSDETVQKTPAKVDNPSDIDGVLAWDTSGYPASGETNAGTLEHQHVTGPVKYAVLPPVGGPHNGTWMNAGVYTKPIPSERAVHNLEHGAIWITYDPNLPPAQVQKLVSFVGKQSLITENEQSDPNQANRFMDLSPWATNDLPSPIVISSWGYQLRVTSPTDPRLQQFVDTFRHNQTYSPEFGAPVDGVPVETGGRPAAYGSKDPNPPGSV